MKNRKGSSLLIVLMILAVTMIFATFTVGFMVTENKQSLYHQHKTQAYYIARSGAVAVEAAILKMDEGQIEKLDGQLDKGEVVVEEIDIDGDKANVVLRKNKEKLYIESVGKKEGISEKVSKVMNRETTTTENIEINQAIFSHGDMVINNGIINGDIGTNGNIKIDGNPTISGDASMALDGRLTAPGWWLDSKWSKDREERRISEINYPLPDFPLYPTNLINKGNIKPTSDNKNPIISKSGYYSNLEIDSNRSITIDTSEGDIVLRVNNFNVSQGNIFVKGSGKVELYIDNFIRLKGGLNNRGNTKSINIFYNGDVGISIDNETKLFGSLYVEKADINIAGSGAISGNLISGGNKINISGGSYVHNGLIYAPNAGVDLLGGASISGAIIANTITVSGGATVEYKPEYIDTGLINDGSSASSSISYKPGYFE